MHTDDTDPFFYMDDGEECINESEALSQLLHYDVLFCNYYDVNHHMFKDCIESTVVLFVNCNDMFWWGTADAEPLPSEESLIKLYKLWKANGYWGVVKWCCVQRQMRPQHPIEKDMKEAGYWDGELEAFLYREDTG